MSFTGMPSVMQTTSSKSGIHAFQDGIGGKGRRHEDGGGGRAGLLHGLGHGVEDRNFFAAMLEALPALAGRDAGDDLRAVIQARAGCAARRSCR